MVPRPVENDKKPRKAKSKEQEIQLPPRLGTYDRGRLEYKKFLDEKAIEGLLDEYVVERRKDQATPAEEVDYLANMYCSSFSILSFMHSYNWHKKPLLGKVKAHPLLFSRTTWEHGMGCLTAWHSENMAWRFILSTVILCLLEECNMLKHVFLWDTNTKFRLVMYYEYGTLWGDLCTNMWSLLWCSIEKCLISFVVNWEFDISKVHKTKQRKKIIEEV